MMGISFTLAVSARRCLSKCSPICAAADPLARKTSSLSDPPPRSTRFGSPLVLSRVHWVEPTLAAEITYLTWTADNLLRHTVYVGLREDKPAGDVRREAARAR
jgi:bifunctional non-homologous end joining protein LigD